MTVEVLKHKIPKGRELAQRISCVIQWEGKLYGMVRQTSDRYGLIPIRWDSYRGFLTCVTTVPREVLFHAERLVCLHERSPETYPLLGEWYELRNQGTEQKCALSLFPIGTKWNPLLRWLLPWTLQLLWAIFVGAIMTAVCMNSALKWLGAILLFDSLYLRIFVVACEGVGVMALFLVLKDHRSPWELTLNAAVPLGLILVCGILVCHPWMWLVLALGSAGTAAIVVAVRSLEPRGKRKKGRALAAWLRKALIFLLLAMILPSQIFELDARMQQTVPDALTEPKKSELMAYYEDNFEYLEEPIWDRLRLSEQHILLQRVVDYECTFVLGCEPPTVEIEEIADEGVLGRFCPLSKKIVVDREHVLFNEVDQVVETVLHEARHAYQKYLVQMYQSLQTSIRPEDDNLEIFQEARAFEKEFEKGELRDYDEYYAQAIERDSRSFADQRMMDYYLSFIYPG